MIIYCSLLWIMLVECVYLERGPLSRHINNESDHLITLCYDLLGPLGQRKSSLICSIQRISMREVICIFAVMYRHFHLQQYPKDVIQLCEGIVNDPLYPSLCLDKLTDKNQVQLGFKLCKVPVTSEYFTYPMIDVNLEYEFIYGYPSQCFNYLIDSDIRMLPDDIIRYCQHIQSHPSLISCIISLLKFSKEYLGVLVLKDILSICQHASGRPAYIEDCLSTLLPALRDSSQLQAMDIISFCILGNPQELRPSKSQTPLSCIAHAAHIHSFYRHDHFSLKDKMRLCSNLSTPNVINDAYILTGPVLCVIDLLGRVVGGQDRYKDISIQLCQRAMDSSPVDCFMSKGHISDFHLKALFCQNSSKVTI